MTEALGKKFEVVEKCDACDTMGDYCITHLIAYCNWQNKALLEAAEELELLQNYGAMTPSWSELKELARKLRISAGETE